MLPSFSWLNTVPWLAGPHVFVHSCNDGHWVAFTLGCCEWCCYEHGVQVLIPIPACTSFYPKKMLFIVHKTLDSFNFQAS